jgi:hypothetical protein
MFKQRPIGPGQPIQQPHFPQDFHNPGVDLIRTLSHRYASDLIQSTYAKPKPCGKLKKITQRLHFGYCQGGFRWISPEKCENRNRLPLFGFRLPASAGIWLPRPEIDLWLRRYGVSRSISGSRIAEAGSRLLCHRLTKKSSSGRWTGTASPATYRRRSL